jgi:uncharacterized protein YgiM (DUF1202 family)
LVIGLTVATSALAQVNTNTLPPIPAPLLAPPVVAAVTNAPAKKAAVKHKKKKAVVKKAAAATTPKPAAFSEPTVTLVPGPAEVAVDNLNVRGQAGLKGEFITHLGKGSLVNVLSQINLDKHKAGEPAAWAKISVPTNVLVWVRSSFIDDTNKTVLPKKLNLRAGPGENYSVLGVIERGTVISDVITKGEWTQIEPPGNAYAFVAAIYLKQEASGTLVATNIPASPETAVTPIAAIPEPPATTNTVAEPPAIVTQPALPVAAAPQPAPPVVPVAPPVVPAVAPTVTDTNVVVEDTNPPPPRIVTHEGFVRYSVSLVAPTYFELYDPANSKAINYLFSPTTNLNLSRYDGYHIIVTGEEGLASRWKDTPVLTVQRIYVLSTNAPNSRVTYPY